jgi:hypothetical protein
VGTRAASAGGSLLAIAAAPRWAVGTRRPRDLVTRALMVGAGLIASLIAVEVAARLGRR